MQAILADIDALMGVTGTFVFGTTSGLLARTLPAATTDASLVATGRALMQTIRGLEGDRHKKVGEFELVYKTGVILVKNLGAGCLCVLCGRQANLPMINMTANMAARKLKETVSAAQAAPAAAAPAPTPTAAPVGAIPGEESFDGTVVAQLEHELARAIGPVAGLIIDEVLAAEHASRISVPRRVLPAVLDRLSMEIKDEAKRAHFRQAADKIA